MRMLQAIKILAGALAVLLAVVAICGAVALVGYASLQVGLTVLHVMQAVALFA